MDLNEIEVSLKGKVFLIGLTIINNNHEVVEQYQTHGIFHQLTDSGLIRIKRKDGSIFQLPYDNDAIKSLEKGEYRERSTGEIIKDPDFLMTWEIRISDGEDTEVIKKHGYIPPKE